MTMPRKKTTAKRDQPSKLISEQLRQIIRDSGRSQYEICLACRVNKASLSKFMRGSHLNTTSIDRMAEYLGFRLVADECAAYDIKSATDGRARGSSKASKKSKRS